MIDDELAKDHFKMKELIIKLEQENKELKELCDKYEKEQSTTFKIWLKEIDKSKQKDELIEKIKYTLKNQIKIIKEQPSKDLEFDNYWINYFTSILNLIKEYKNETNKI